MNLLFGSEPAIPINITWAANQRYVMILLFLFVITKQFQRLAVPKSYDHTPQLNEGDSPIEII